MKHNGAEIVARDAVDELVALQIASGLLPKTLKWHKKSIFEIKFDEEKPFILPFFFFS